MKVIVFGATGSIGKQLVKQSLEKGYEVYAFCRDVNKLAGYEHLNLKMIEGDVQNPDQVQNAVKGVDIVSIVLGSGKSRTSAIRSEGTKNVIEAMKHTGVKRLICQTTLGAGESWGNLNLFWKYIMFGWYIKKVFQDHELQEEYVRNSGLDWTIIRPAAFTNGEKTGNYRMDFDPNDRSLKLKISRADVADFTISQFESKNFLHKSPGLSY